MRLGPIAFLAAASIGACLQSHSGRPAAPPPSDKPVKAAATAPADKIPKKTEPAPASPSTSVKVTGSLSANVVTTGARVSGFVTIANDSAEALTQVRILVHVPDGFSFQGARVEQDRPASLACLPVDSVVMKCEVPDAVPKGSERAVTIEWQAGPDESPQSADVTVEWNTGTAGPGSSRSLSLGELSSESSWKLWVTGNPLFLPLLTGVLGGLIVAIVQAWLAGREKRREEDRAKQAKIDEEGRAADARQLDEERTHKIATWDLMLPQSHELAMRHYVPMQMFVGGAIAALQRYEAALKPGAAPDPEFADLPVRAFLCLVLFARRMQYSTDIVGGLYFKNRTGEEIVSHCYYAYRKFYFDRNIQDRRKYEAVLRKISPKSRVAALYEKLQSAASGTAPAATDPKAVAAFELGIALRDLFSGFEKLWIKGAQSTEVRAKEFSILKGFFAVMQFEMNRPYRYWYNKPSFLEIDDDAKTALETLGENEDFGRSEGWKKFRDRAKTYLRDAMTLGTEESAESKD